ncbi:hypothetical protein Cs308_0306 [Candidatus Chlamydia sanziniae]|uniref:Uncharacterized protein n=1 Tax=Candidatus Chlamydia sanziniae TaxID=1806891 RepID=A0A1A9HUU7_9CHLA|nr:hypothetical protein Cs308_0306 [Candidatus Chlamydia sanziniae]
MWIIVLCPDHFSPGECLLLKNMVRIFLNMCHVSKDARLNKSSCPNCVVILSSKKAFH